MRGGGFGLFCGEEVTRLGMRHAVASAEFVSDQRDGDLALFCLDPVTGGIGKGVDDVEEKGKLGRLPGDGFRSGEWVRYACPDVGARRKLGFGVIIAGTSSGSGMGNGSTPSICCHRSSSTGEGCRVPPSSTR